jgi:hypothetical protein
MGEHLKAKKNGGCILRFGTVVWYYEATGNDQDKCLTFFTSEDVVTLNH